MPCRLWQGYYIGAGHAQTAGDRQPTEAATDS